VSEFFSIGVLCIVLNARFDGIGGACDGVQALEIPTRDVELTALLGAERQNVELLVEKE